MALKKKNDPGGREGPTSRRPRSILRTARNTFILVIITLLLMEVALRIVLFNRFEFMQLTQNDSYRWVRFRPDVEESITFRVRPSILKHRFKYPYRVKINSRGLRADREYAKDPPSLPFRILCLGDSITFGWGVDGQYTYPNLLEQRLSGLRADLNVQVINAGIPSYTSRQGLIWLDRELMDLRPRVVIVQFGFNDNLRSWLRMSGPIMIASDKLVMQGRPGDWHPVDMGGLRGLTGILHKTHTGRIAVVLYTLAIRRWTGTEPGSYPGPRVSPEDYKANLLRIGRLCRENNARMILIEAWGTSDGYRDILRQIERENGIEVFSHANLMVQSIRKMNSILSRERHRTLVEKIRSRFDEDFLINHRRYHLLVDGLHPNELGNTIFAEELAKIILPSLPDANTENAEPRHEGGKDR